MAKEIEADLVIIDDAHARKIAEEEEGLRVVGLLAILLDAKRNSIISEIRPLLDALRQKGFFMDDDLYTLLLHKAGE